MRVLLVKGGRGGEHEIALATGAEVARALTALGHEVFELVLERGERGGGAHWPGGGGGVGAGLAAAEAWSPRVAFLAMHGEDGEDGRIQGALELLGVPYQGSGVQASAIGLDKARTKDVYRLAGLPTAPDRVLTRAEPRSWPALAADLGLPLALKTRSSGSSVGVERVDTVEGLAERGEALLASAEVVLAEAWIVGRELTGPVLEGEDGTPEALPTVEIRPRGHGFFDYAAKYTPGATDELCPAPIDPALEARVRELAVAAHRALGCRGYSRTDVMVDAAGRPYLLETNTLPGLTPASLFPKAAAAAGLTFPDLIERLLRRALA